MSDQAGMTTRQQPAGIHGLAENGFRLALGLCRRTLLEHGPQSVLARHDPFLVRLRPLIRGDRRPDLEAPAETAFRLGNPALGTIAEGEVVHGTSEIMVIG